MCATSVELWQSSAVAIVWQRTSSKYAMIMLFVAFPLITHRATGIHAITNFVRQTKSLVVVDFFVVLIIIKLVTKQTRARKKFSLTFPIENVRQKSRNKFIKSNTNYNANIYNRSRQLWLNPPQCPLLYRLTAGKSFSELLQLTGN